jgi:hypothetical protein
MAHRGSTDYRGSMAHHGSGATHGSGAHRGPMAHHGSGATHGSGAHRGSMAHHGSGATHGSGAHRGSTNHQGSTTHHGSTVYYGSGAARGSGARYWSATVSGSIPKSASSNRYWAPTIQYGSTKITQSGIKQHSTNRGSSSKQYNMFAPTLKPTENLPPTYNAPNPTFTPTTSFIIPDIPLTFQIDHDLSGYSDPPQLKIALTNEVSKITDLDTKYITNMEIYTNSRRLLNTVLRVHYNITLPLTPLPSKSIYNTIIYKLTNSVKTGTFSSDLQKQGYNINVTNIIISPYVPITKSPNTNAIESQQNTNLVNTSQYIFISVMTLLTSALTFSSCYYVYIRQKRNKQETKFIDNIPNPLQSVG